MADGFPTKPSSNRSVDLQPCSEREDEVLAPSSSAPSVILVTKPDCTRTRN